MCGVNKHMSHIRILYVIYVLHLRTILRIRNRYNVHMCMSGTCRIYHMCKQYEIFTSYKNAKKTTTSTKKKQKKKKKKKKKKTKKKKKKKKKLDTIV